MIKIEPKVNTRALINLKSVAPNIATEAVKEVALYAETRIGVNANKFVYSKPASPTYVRTGRLLGGRGSAFSGGGKPARVNHGPQHVELMANPQLKGASTNYAPFVNKGTRMMAARPFFDISVSETKAKTPQIISEVAKNKAKI